MRLLVIGQDSAIGGALAAAAAGRGDTVIGTSRRNGAPFKLDLGTQTFAALPDADMAVFVAAMSRFVDCRDRPALARQIDVAGPAAVARELAARGTRLILLSTAAVFDGSKPYPLENELPAPASAYGEFKAEAEREFLALGGCVLRMTKVLGADNALFAGWIEKLVAGETIAAFTDLIMAPVALEDAVQAILPLCAAEVKGIYHLSASREINYFDAARHIAARLGVSRALVTAGRALESGLDTSQIVRHATLGGERLTQLTGRSAPDPIAALDRIFASHFLEERR